MSNFLRTRKRMGVIKERKEVKYRMKQIYKIMDELDSIAPIIYKNETNWNEENIVEIAEKYTNRKLEKLEQMLLLGKLQNIKDGKADNK